MDTNRTLLPAAPPLAIGAGLLLWGWQNNFFLFAIPMALILESSRFMKWRWPITDKEFNNIADLSGVIFFLVVVYIFFTVRSQGIFTILTILPFVFFLVVLTQLFSDRGFMKLSSLFISLRKLPPEREAELDKPVDITLPFIMVCLISASAGNLRTIWFYILVCILIAYILWVYRPSRYHAVAWAMTMILCAGIGFLSQEGIREMQRAVERSIMSMFDQYMWRYRDPNRTTTSMGSIGRLKLSDRVLVRVKTETPLSGPLYLHEATYDSYNYGVWSTVNPDFTVIDPDISGESWTLNDLTSNNRAAITTFMVNVTGVVPAPHGTHEITGPGIIEINQNQNGTINMEMREGWISYNTLYNDDELPAWSPGPRDLEVNSSYREDLERLARELDLYGKPDTEIIRTVHTHFTENFLYSLDRRQRYPRGRYLADFLFENQQGHCEYFATSTVLLLRIMGIPARYATGYYIHEYSNLERLYVGRSRHSHSWVLAYVNNQWQVLDTTPSTWAPYEEETASSLQALYDLSAWVRYQISLWRARGELDEEEEEDSFYLLWLLVPLLLILIWRLYRKERIHTKGSDQSGRAAGIIPGLDSSFYRLARILEDKGYKRRPGETMTSWLARIDSRLLSGKCRQALLLHYRYRFDPEGLSLEARQQLAGIVDDLVMEFGSQPA